MRHTWSWSRKRWNALCLRWPWGIFARNAKKIATKIHAHTHTQMRANERFNKIKCQTSWDLDDAIKIVKELENSQISNFTHEERTLLNPKFTRMCHAFPIISSSQWTCKWNYSPPPSTIALPSTGLPSTTFRSNCSRCTFVYITCDVQAHFFLSSDDDDFISQIDRMNTFLKTIWNFCDLCVNSLALK